MALFEQTKHDLQATEKKGNGQNWIRTSEGVSQRIYSPYLLLGETRLLVVYLSFRNSMAFCKSSGVPL
jgi:hypothetical protein